MKKVFLLLSLVLAPFVALSQTTAISGTVTDLTGQAWIHGNFTATLVNARGGTVTQNGTLVPASAQTLTVMLDGAGSFTSQPLLDNNTLSPVGTQWRFSVCSLTSAQCSSLGPFTITGATMNLTSQFSHVTVPSFSAGQTAFGYKDSEVFPSPQPGGFYYNVVNSVVRVWSGPPANMWQDGGSGDSVLLFNNTTLGYFTDLDPANAGGIAAASGTPSAEAAVEHATALAAACWSADNGGAKATFFKSALYPAHVDNLYIGSNTNFYSTTVSQQTYSGGPTLTEYILGDVSATGGNPAVRVDFTYTDTCGGSAVNLGGNNVDIQGFNLTNAFGSGSGGEADGVRVAANNVHVENISCGGLGGACFENVTGVNNSYDWNYATNVAFWGCLTSNGGTQLSSNVAAGLLAMTDGEAGHNQLSTGCGFARGFHVNAKSYEFLSPMYVNGGGDDIHDNLLQTDEIALIAAGEDHRIYSNRLEYQSAELLRVLGNNYTIQGNKLISGALDSTAPVSGVNQYYGVVDTFGGNLLVGNSVGAEAGVDGPSFYRGSFDLAQEQAVVGNSCNTDSDDTNHNGHCYSGGDQQSTNFLGSAYIGPIYQDGTTITINATTQVPYVGNASNLILTESSPVGLESLSGMIIGNRINVTAINTTETLTAGVFGIRPGFVSCDGFPLILQQGVTYELDYVAEGDIQQGGCPNAPTTLHVNYTSNTAPASTVQGNVDVFGKVASRGEPLLPINQLQNDIAGGSLTYGYEIEYWAGGAHYTTPVRTIGLADSPSNTPTTTTFISITNPPRDCISYNVYRVSTTDPGVTTTGLLASGSCVGPKEMTGSDTGQTLSGGTIPAASIRTGGRFTSIASETGAVTHTTNCTSGENEFWIQDGNFAFCWNGTPFIVTSTAAP